MEIDVLTHVRPRTKSTRPSAGIEVNEATIPSPCFPYVSTLFSTFDFSLNCMPGVFPFLVLHYSEIRFSKEWANSLITEARYL